MKDRPAIEVAWSGGQTGPGAVLMHANGFVPGAYRPFLQALAPHLRIEALSTRGQHGFAVPSSQKPFRWSDLGEDLGQWVEQSGRQGAIGIGHSMGATALIFAAHRFPSAFRALVLIEPASLAWPMVRLAQLFPGSLLRRMQPMKGALSKRDHWPDKASFLESCRRSGMYSKFNDEAMQAFVEHAIRPCPQGYCLVYPKLWEAHNYAQVCDPVPTLRKLSLPIFGIRGANSFFMNDRKWQRFVKSGRFAAHTKLSQYGHLVPLEGPKDCAQALVSGLQDMGCLPESTQETLTTNEH